MHEPARSRPAGVDFRNFEYAGAGDDALAGTGLDRTREGYVEMIEMGTLEPAPTAAAVTHDRAASRRTAAWSRRGFTPVPAGRSTPPTGGLMGTGTLINVQQRPRHDYKADALDAWQQPPRSTRTRLRHAALVDATPATSLVIRSGDLPANGASTQITAYRSDFVTTSGRDRWRACRGLDVHAHRRDERVHPRRATASNDRLGHHPADQEPVRDAAPPPRPYTDAADVGRCVRDDRLHVLQPRRSERDGLRRRTSRRCLRAPPPTRCAGSRRSSSIRNDSAHTPADTTVSTVLGSVNVTNVSVTTGFQNGWALARPSRVPVPTPRWASARVAPRRSASRRAPTRRPSARRSTGDVTFFGLPVTGFMVRTFVNGTLTCGTGACQGNYGGLFVHSYRTTITP